MCRISSPVHGHHCGAKKKTGLETCTHLEPHPSRIQIMLVVWWWWSRSLTSDDGGGRCLSPKTHHHLHWTYIYKKHQLVLKYTKKERKKTHWGPNDVSDTSFGFIFILPVLCRCYCAGCAGAGCCRSSVQLGCGHCICCAGSCRHRLLQGIVIDVMVTWWWWCGDVVTWWGIDGGGKATRVTVTNIIELTEIGIWWHSSCCQIREFRAGMRDLRKY